MKSKRIFGIVVLLVGVAMIFFSMYIMNEVTSGRAQISQAKRNVDQGTKIFNISPVTRGVGQTLSSSANKKIGKYSEEADRYERMAQLLRVGGIVLIVVGGVIIFLSRKKKA